jgi:F-type H+-transporting ATPase subunit epsilon
MAEALDLEIVTPERLLVKEQVSEVQVPAKDGYLGILPGHAALLSELGTGFLSYTVGSRKRFLALHGGFVEVLPDQVRILANIAEKAEEIDVEKARAALQKAENDMINPALGVDPAIALEQVALAQARVSAGEQKG